MRLMVEPGMVAGAPSRVLSHRSMPRLNLRATSAPKPEDYGQENYDMARFIMALRARNIRNTPIMAAFEHTPRGAFFDPAFEPYLYQDITLPLPCGEEASSAFFIARMLTAANIQPHEQVLEIGTGSGYLTALLGLLARRVVSIDRFRTLATLARKSLSVVGRSQIDLRVGDGLAGYDLPQSNFDCIIVNGAVSHVPEALADRLLPNGRIILCLDDENGQHLQSAQFLGTDVKIMDHGRSNLAPMKPGRARSL